MARSINKVTILGRIGKDPEVKYTPGGKAVARLSVATSEQWKDRNGEKQEKTEWHTVVAWDKLAEVLQKYVTKGDLVYIEGKLETRSWEKDGRKHYATEITAKEIVLLGSKAAPAAPAGDAKHDWASTRSTASTEITDDDIPF